MLVKEFVIPELEESTPSRQYWTAEEDSILRSYYGKAKNREIADYLKRSLRSVENRARILGLMKSRGMINQ